MADDPTGTGISSSAGSAGTSGQAPSSVAKLTYQGTNTASIDGELQYGKYILPLGVEVEVPADVAEHLTTGENKALYKIKVG
jgi:hypothetical protein